MQAQVPEQAPLTHQDLLNIKYLVDQPSVSVEEAWKRLPKEVQTWLKEHGFDDPVFVLDPADALAKLAMALAGYDYDYNVVTVKTDDGDAVIIDVWIPGVGYDTLVVVLPDGDVIAFQYG